jgi:phytol kinase
MLTAFWLNQIIKFFLLWAIQYGNGLLVHHKGIKVNYTRKINHFFLFFLPMYLDKVIAFEQSFGLFTLGCALGVSSLFIYIEPVRKRIRIVERMFQSFDRPEDRPNTMLWLSTQIVVGFLVVIPAVIFFVKSGYLNLILIPILIAGIGDGLAEPVGVRFGRLKYRTYALFSKKKYVRTIEGSCCVLITSIIVILFFKQAFTPQEFIAALISIPVIMTLAEAFSPHTWDQPFLFLMGYASLYFIKWYPTFG